MMGTSNGLRRRRDRGATPSRATRRTSPPVPALALCGLLQALLTGCTHGECDDTARCAPGPPPVSIHFSDHPEDFRGHVELLVTTIDYDSVADGQLRVTADAWSTEGGEVASWTASLTLDQAARALRGERTEPVSSRYVSARRARFDRPIDGLALQLVDGSFRMDAVSGTTEIVAEGPFGVACVPNRDGTVTADASWSSDFCASVRDRLALDPWIAAAR